MPPVYLWTAISFEAVYVVVHQSYIYYCVTKLVNKQMSKDHMQGNKKSHQFRADGSESKYSCRAQSPALILFCSTLLKYF